MKQTRGQVHNPVSGPTGTRRSRRCRLRVGVVVPLLAAGVLLTGCSDPSSDPGSGGPSATGERDRALAFAECMRKNGVEKFPDPGDDGGVMVGKDSGIDPESAEFKKAQEACQDLAPQGGGGDPKDGKPADLEKARTWAKCIRDNGVPDFPDPERDGNTLIVDMTGVGTGGEDPTLEAAMDTCKDKRPAGNIRMRQNGGGQ
ncbi:hypothetical protein AB0M28_32450 [Streptomyces sp. NPDC051940]|uniref:hypothetical protein n=1 Tax=Streptomyces sp. NPDC051940 TaxID=3155675 RepID=UPI00341D1425